MRPLCCAKATVLCIHFWCAAASFASCDYVVEANEVELPLNVEEEHIHCALNSSGCVAKI